MDRLEVSPRSVRGYGNIIIPKLSTDFVGKYNEIYTDEDGYFVLSYGGVMLKASATVSNTIKGIQASLTVLISTRDSDTPVSGLSVDCSVDSVALTGQTTDSTGKCTFTWTPSDLGDSSLLITVTPQDDYAGLSLDKTVTVGLLLGFDGIMTSLSLEDDEVYSGTFEEDVEDRSQLSEFVKDVWVASGGEPIVDEYGIIHICEPGDLVVESEGLEQLPEYSNVLFEEDVDLLTGAVYDMSISEDYEIVLDCLERDDIVPDVPVPSYDGVSLTSDKSILSYADGDTCTLTAQLTDDGSPASVEGVTVEFFNGSTSLGTADTNSSGIATKTYTSAGVGDMTLTAGVDSIISSEIYVEDCIRSDGATSDKTSNYSSNNLNSLTFSSDHYEAYRSIGTSPSSTFYSPVYIDDTLPSDFELSVMYNSSKMNTEQIEFIIASTHPTTYSGATELGIIVTDARRGLFHRLNGSLTWYTEASTLSNNTWYTFYLQVEGTTVTAKILDSEGDTVYTSTQTISNAQNYKKWSIINGGTSRTLSFKNLKIKSL